jgi:regulator of nonsense transcripts 2
LYRPDDDKHLYKLDSSLKKNTAFTKKCKMINESSKDQLIKEMKGLNLSKYIEELSQILVESKFKMSDISGVVEFCSAVHQVYPEFSVNLLENWNKVLAMKKEDKVVNPSKLRVDLRLYSELISVGIFSLKESLSLLGNVLMTLVAQDKETLSNISIIISFCKHCGDDYAGLLPFSILQLAEKYGYTLPRADLLPPEKQKPLKNILKGYYQCLCNALLAIHKEVAMLERGNRRQMLTRGEINSERKEKLKNLQQEKDKLVTNTAQMAEAVGEDMIVLPSHHSEKDEEEEAELAAEVSEDNLGALWDDDESKAFYENLPDLKETIPSILYKEGKDEAEAEQKENKKDTADNLDDDDIQMDEEDVEEVNLDDEEEPENSNVSNKMALEAFLAQLPHCVNREMTDNASAEFCLSFNTKANRKKLVKSLFTVHRTRTDLLPFYSRLCAILSPILPDVPVQLCALLKQEFRWQVRKKDQVYIESKLKVCRFIGEMVKFNLFPKSDALFCLKQLLFDFTHHHIEMACTLVESCGAFLYRTPETHRRTKIYIEQMIRKKAALSFDAKYVTMIENASYLVIPTESQQENRIERPPKHQYIRKLLYTDLNKSNVEKVLRQVRKFNWEDPVMAAYLVKCIKNVWNIKYYNIRYLASLLAGLIHYHEWVGVTIADDILEDIR